MTADVAATVWLGAVAAAMVAILLVRRWLATHPFGLPPLEVEDDDPLMAEAQARARRTLPSFLELLPAHPGRAYVRFACAMDGGGAEHLWARVERRDGERLAVRVETPPAGHEDPFDPERTIALAEVEDWQVDLEDGTIRGGFTLHAMFRIWRRDVGDLPRRHRAREALYVDCTKVAQ